MEHEYVLIVDDDADRIAAAVRGCGEACPAPALVARSADDAIRLLEQMGSPALLMVSLVLRDRDGLSVIESLRRIDETAPVIAWAADRELREYAASRLVHTRAKVLRCILSPALCRRCVGALLQRETASSVAIAAGVNDAEENWLDLAERARQRLGVVGAAAYAKAEGAAEYTMSVSWMPDAAMPNFPALLSTAVEEVLANGAAKILVDPAERSNALRSVAIVPIVRDDKTVGALCAFDVEPHAFRQRDVDTLTAIAGGSTPRRGVPPVPMDRDEGEAVIRRELARVSHDREPLSVVLFSITTRRADDVPAVDDMLATMVRGNDVVVRWTSSEALVLLTGVDNHVAERVAERISDVVRTKASDRIALARTVTELGTAESFQDTIARAAEAIRMSPSGSRAIRKRHVAARNENLG